MAASRALGGLLAMMTLLQKRNEFQLLRYPKHKKLQYLPLKLANFDHRYLINEKT